jgi:hypothetical protein
MPNQNRQPKKSNMPPHGQPSGEQGGYSLAAARGRISADGHVELFDIQVTPVGVNPTAPTQPANPPAQAAPSPAPTRAAANQAQRGGRRRAQNQRVTDLKK